MSGGLVPARAKNSSGTQTRRPFRCTCPDLLLQREPKTCSHSQMGGAAQMLPYRRASHERLAIGARRTPSLSVSIAQRRRSCPASRSGHDERSRTDAPLWTDVIRLSTGTALSSTNLHRHKGLNRYVPYMDIDTLGVWGEDALRAPSRSPTVCGSTCQELTRRALQSPTNYGVSRRLRGDARG